jgi:tRNA(Ile2) C34 agmatinyltransferase TiaS
MTHHARLGSLGHVEVTLAKGGRVPAGFVTAVREAVLEAVTQVYARVRKCPQCGAAFLKQGKQTYCSPVCGQEMRMARFLARRPNYYRERERAQGPS